MKFILPPIYPITDKKLAHRTSHLSILRELVRGGARLVQVRDKTTPIQELLPDLQQCVEFAAKTGAKLIVDDRCDLVLCSRAMGVHLGQQDLPPAAARAVMGSERIIGFSTHTLWQVRKSVHLPIQYVGFGPIYATSTKEDSSPAVGLKRLIAACKISAVPVVAVGGIRLEHVREVLEAGAASIAVISALMRAKNIALQMQRFLDEARVK